MFEQHEQTLQNRIAVAKENFQDAKACLEESKKMAGKLNIHEISDDEELPAESSTSAQQITASIQSLSMSLQQLSKEAEAIPVEERTAKRQRVKEPAEITEEMTDGGKPPSFH